MADQTKRSGPVSWAQFKYGFKMQVHFIIDGYNLLHALCGPPAGGDSLESGRERLLLAIKNSSLYPRHQFTIVFDGTADVYPRREKRSDGPVTVIFARPPDNADSLILKICARAPNPERLEVVSSDRAHIVKKVDAMGIQTCSAESFVGRLLRKRKKSSVDTREKPEPSRNDTAYWSDIFDNSWCADLLFSAAFLTRHRRETAKMAGVTWTDKNCPPQ